MTMSAPRTTITCPDCGRDLKRTERGDVRVAARLVSCDGVSKYAAPLYGRPFSVRVGIHCGTVVIGDTGHDVDCGQANHFRTVAVDTGWVDREELVAAQPDALLDDFTDLEAALTALGVPRA